MMSNYQKILNGEIDSGGAANLVEQLEADLDMYKGRAIAAEQAREPWRTRALEAETRLLAAARDLLAAGPLPTAQPVCKITWGQLHATTKERATDNTRLPEGMKECQIIFKECSLGHGWLTDANWVQAECPTCKQQQLEKEMAAYKICYEEMVAGRALDVHNLCAKNDVLEEELGSLKEVLWATQFDAEQERKAKKLTQTALIQMRKERDELQGRLL